MEQTFFFIDGVNADRASKRLMRRHVMKGKNAGKTLHRPSRMGKQVARRQPIGKKIDRPICNPLRSFPFPVEVTAVASKAIHDFFNLTSDLIYPVQLGFSLHEAKCKWLEILFLDEATYDCTLALIQASNETVLGSGNNSPNALQCLARTLAQVRKRLHSRDALSDSTIAIVISLIHQEQVAQHHADAEAHIRGLKRIVDLRGGLNQIEDNNPLVLKICKTDITFSMQQDGPTLFHRDRMHEIYDLVASKGLRFDRSSEAYSVSINRLDLFLQDILLDIMGTCKLFNNYLREQPLGLYDFQEVLVSVCYRLLKFRTLAESRQKSDIQSAYHIGLIIFMISIFLQNNQGRMIKHGLIIDYVKYAFESKLDEHEDELKFWLLMLGGIWASGADEQEWAVSRLRGIASMKGIMTWDDARSYLGKLPWIDVIHSPSGQKLWDQVCLERVS